MRLYAGEISSSSSTTSDSASTISASASTTSDSATTTFASASTISDSATTTSTSASTTSDSASTTSASASTTSLVGFFTSLTVEIIKEQQDLLDTMKYFCSLYLLYLSYLIMKDDPKNYKQDVDSLESPMQFKDGFVLQFINGKVIFYYIILMTGTLQEIMKELMQT